MLLYRSATIAQSRREVPVNYVKFPLHQQNGGNLVEVTLSGVESDVMLVDQANLASFERGREFRYTGGHYKRSLVRLRTPASGDWTVVVIPGSGGSVRASVRVHAA